MAHPINLHAHPDAHHDEAVDDRDAVEQEVKLQLACQMNETDALERESADVVEALMNSLRDATSSASNSVAATIENTSVSTHSVCPKCYTSWSAFK